MTKSETQTIADILDMTRKLTLYYLAKIDEGKLREAAQLNGVPMNPPYWIMAHLAWAERNLVLDATGAPALEYAWLDRFMIGSEGDLNPEDPPVSELRATMDAIHELALARIVALDPEVLDEAPAVPGFSSVRTNLYHAIRHEAMHVGQLSWFCKTTGVDTP